MEELLRVSGAGGAWAKVPPLVGGGFPIAALQLVSVYYVGALSVHLLIPVLAKAVTPVAPNAKGKRNPADSRAGQILRESFLSLGPISVKAAVFCAVEQIHERGLGFLYDGRLALAPSVPAQVLLLAGTVLLLDVLHDTWFYFTHLLMHKNKWLLANVHYLHHQSKLPTPFSGYSLHVVEAAIVFFDEILVCFLFPIHVKVHRLYHLYTTLIHIGGHATYELHPLVPSLEQFLWIGLHGDKVSASLNTVLYHNMHHQHPSKNFSLYFTHWDRRLATIKKGYDEEISKIKAKQENLASAAFPHAGKSNGLRRYYLVLVAAMAATLALCLAAYFLACFGAHHLGLQAQKL